jgi:hypothetical protein
MKIVYDAEADALSITFRETTVTTQHAAEGITRHSSLVTLHRSPATRRLSPPCAYSS